MFMTNKYIILYNIEEYKKFEFVMYANNIQSGYINWLLIKDYISFPLILYIINNNSIDTVTHENLEYLIKVLNLTEIFLEDVLKY